jgi:hypothetical protein
VEDHSDRLRASSAPILECWLQPCGDLRVIDAVLAAVLAAVPATWNSRTRSGDVGHVAMGEGPCALLERFSHSPLENVGIVHGGDRFVDCFV